jgi:hypothetical protein
LCGPDIGALQTVAKLVGASQQFSFFAKIGPEPVWEMPVMGQNFFNPSVTRAIRGSSLIQRHMPPWKPVSKGKTHQ